LDLILSIGDVIDSVQKSGETDDEINAEAAKAKKTTVRDCKGRVALTQLRLQISILNKYFSTSLR